MNEFNNVLQEQIIIRGGMFYLFLKRFFDLFCSFFALIILLLPMLIIALLIKINSKGKVIFLDKRVGLNGKDLNIFKFRTMYADAETNIEKYLTPEQIESWEKERKVDNDPRITSIGKFLRKTSLDELPQLLNILLGSLSLVGPRPITREELTQNYTPYEQERLVLVKPGLTGMWQVNGRSSVDYASGKRQKEELSYLPKRSIWLDIKIIFLTIPAVFKQNGAK